MRVSSRDGLTRAEVLVLVILVGLFLAMLFPWTTINRGPSRRAICMNNQKQLSLAMLNFESSRGSFPGYESTVRNLNLTVNQRQVCWVVPLFPYIERSDLWNKWSDQDPFADTDGNGTADGHVLLKYLVCPNDPPDQTLAGSTPLAYVVNAGLVDAFNSAAINTPDDVRLSAKAELAKPSGMAVPREASNGVCHYLLTSDTEPQGLQVSLGYISNHDGTHATLLLSERLRTESKSMWGENPEPGTSPEKHWGFCWRWADDAADLASARLTDHLSSYHGGGVVASFCDGHVTFLDEEIDYRVYQHLMTPDSQAAHKQAAAALGNDVNVAGDLKDDDF